MGKPIVLETTADINTGGIKQPFVIREKLSYIVNDSPNYDLLINFDATVNELGVFTLKAGEILEDVNMSCNTVSVQGVNGPVAFRMLGV